MRRNDTQYSKFWMGDEEFTLDPKEVSLWDADALLKLASFKRAVGNFVRIVTGKPVPVLYNTGEQSYTSGEMVVLSAKLEHNQFDTAVGTALHEGSHCVLTDFKMHNLMQQYQKVLAEMVVKHIPLSEMRYRFESAVLYSGSDAETVNRVNAILATDPKIVADVLDKMFRLNGNDPNRQWMIESLLWEQSKWFENWVEDRRIDYWQTLNSPGYRGYYNAMYETYFYTKLVGRAVKAKNYARTETWESYRFRVTNLLHPDSDLDALKGLREIWNVIDVKNVSRLKSTLDSWMLSFQILNVMYKYLEVEKKRQETEQKSPKSPSRPSKKNDTRNVRDHQYEDEIDENDQPSDAEQNDGQSGEGEEVDDNRTGDDNYDQSQPSNMGGEKSDDESGKSDDEKSEDEGEKSDESDEDSDSTDAGEGEGNGSGNSSDEETEDEDNLSPQQMKKMEKEEDKQGKFLEGETPKKKMDSKVSKALDAIDKSGVSLEGVGSGLMDANGKPLNLKIQCVVIRNVTKELIDSGTFGHMFYSSTDSWVSSYTDAHQKAIEEGFRLGTILGKKLQIRNESRTTRFSRLETGRIDKRLLASLGYQNDRVFYRTQVDKYNPLMLHISVDASGSMQGEKWQKTMTSLVAIIKAASMTTNLHVVVSMRGTTDGTSTRARRSRRRWGSTARVTNGYSISTRPLIAIVYDSRVDKLSKVMSLFKYINPNGSTPEGLAFEPIIDEMVVGKKDEMESIFLNLSDGEPAFSATIGDDGVADSFYYHGEVGGKHTASMIQRMRSLNIRVLSYIIQEGGWRSDEHCWDIFRMCYGKDARKIDVKNIVELARTLNEKFLEKSN